MPSRAYPSRTVVTNEHFRGSTTEWDYLWRAAIPPGHEEARILDAGSGEHVWTVSDYKAVVRCDCWQSYSYRQKKLPKGIIEADLNKPWPFKDDSFAGVTCIDVLEHLENPWHFVREATRVATDWVCVAVPNPHCPISQALFAKQGTFYCFTWPQLQNSHHLVPLFAWQVPLLEQACGWKADMNVILDAPTSGYKGWQDIVPKELHALAQRQDTRASRLLRFTCTTGRRG